MHLESASLDAANRAPHARAEMPESGHLSARERKMVAAIAAAAIPSGRIFPGGGESTVERLDQWLGGAARRHARAVRGLLWAVELAPVPFTGRPLSKLPRERAAAFLESWSESRLHLRRAMLRAALSPIKVAHFDDPAMFEAVGCPSFHDVAKRVKVAETPRWMSQVTDGRKVDEPLDLECEVVVVGTGAGGAAVAYELARRGRAVLMIEEGDFVRRDRMSGRTQEMIKKLYRDQGFTIALGNVGIPVFAGRAVGGTTVVNSGTCYRAPERIFRKWRDEMGLGGFSSETMAPYYERVEQMLGVSPAKAELTGGVGRVIARGAEALGLRHHAIRRNAPDCDGQGVCCFGCPTGAKRSTDVSYVPEALLRGAQLVTAARVEGIDTVAGRARGVRGTLSSGQPFRVKAGAVVVSAGSLMTPVLLRRAGVCTASEYLGKNLSIHPATYVMATFDERIDMGSAIPQGWTIDELREEGIMLEGGSTPLDITSVGIPFVGKKLVELLEEYAHIANFGLMVEDTSRGEVRPGPGGSPLIRYSMNKVDTKKMQRGVALLCEVYLAAGAKRVLPFVPGMPEVRSKRDVEKLQSMRVSAGDFEVTAYHPLGTCRIGTDPRTSVLNPEHEAHEVAGLYVADGSAVPSALGVNPQLTIMAMALRAAEAIDARLPS